MSSVRGQDRLAVFACTLPSFRAKKKVQEIPKRGDHLKIASKNSFVHPLANTVKDCKQAVCRTWLNFQLAGYTCSIVFIFGAPTFVVVSKSGEYSKPRSRTQSTTLSGRQAAYLPQFSSYNSLWGKQRKTFLPRKKWQLTSHATQLALTDASRHNQSAVQTQWMRTSGVT